MEMHFLMYRSSMHSIRVILKLVGFVNLLSSQPPECLWLLEVLVQLVGPGCDLLRFGPHHVSHHVTHNVTHNVSTVSISFRYRFDRRMGHELLKVPATATAPLIPNRLKIIPVVSHAFVLNLSFCGAGSPLIVLVLGPLLRTGTCNLKSQLVKANCKADL